MHNVSALYAWINTIRLQSSNVIAVLRREQFTVGIVLSRKLTNSKRLLMYSAVRSTNCAGARCQKTRYTSKKPPVL